jgi:hypothetical protein
LSHGDDKTNSNLKKETLKISSADIEGNRLLFSIVSSESDLKICMLLNSCLGISLALDEEIVVKRKSRVIRFRKYNYENDELLEKYLLFSNYAEGEYLFPELKKNDFLLLINTELDTASIEDRIHKLRQLPEISGIFKIESSNIRSLRKIKI